MRHFIIISILFFASFANAQTYSNWIRTNGPLYLNYDQGVDSATIYIGTATGTKDRAISWNHPTRRFKLDWNTFINGWLDVNSHGIVNLLDPTTAQGAATKNYVDTTTLATSWIQYATAASLSNPTLTSYSGPGNGAILILQKTGEPDECTVYRWTSTTWPEAAPYSEPGNGGSWIAIGGVYGTIESTSGTLTVGNATLGGHALNLTTGLSTFIRVDGGNSMAANLNLNTHTIVNVQDPVNPQDAVTLNYAGNNYLAKNFIRLVPVTDIADPDELSTVAGLVEGYMVLAYESTDNLQTLYRYVPSGVTANSPYVVPALTSGFWTAIAGKYATADGAFSFNNNIDCANITSSGTIAAITGFTTGGYVKALNIRDVDTGTGAHIRLEGGQLGLGATTGNYDIVITPNNVGIDELHSASSTLTNLKASDVTISDEVRAASALLTTAKVHAAPTDASHVVRLDDLDQRTITPVGPFEITGIARTTATTYTGVWGDSTNSARFYFPYKAKITALSLYFAPAANAGSATATISINGSPDSEIEVVLTSGSYAKDIAGNEVDIAADDYIEVNLDTHSTFNFSPGPPTANCALTLWAKVGKE